MSACVAVVHQGLPCLQLRLGQGDSALVSLHGAQVLSWVAGGRERLFLSPRSVLDGRAAIRGGVPVCFPQFNQRGSLPKHGFARHRRWSVAQADPLERPATDGQVACELTLTSDADTLALWPHPFLARLTVTLSAGQLRVGLAVHNTGQQDLAFTGALHTYLAVDDIAAVQLRGLGGQPEWDAVSDTRGQAAEVLGVDGEFDRVYQAAPQALTLEEAGRTLRVAQSQGFEHTVVWNPGASQCAKLADMPADGYRQMLCVEAAQVYTPITVAPGQVWQGWQQLTVA